MVYNQVRTHQGKRCQGRTPLQIPNDMAGWTKIVLSNIFLTVETHNQTTHDPLYYLVQGDQANLWFAKNGSTWTLVRWEDKPIGGLGTRASTWGQIKGLFR